MSNERVTLVVSDLHVGGGAADKGDDHIYDKRQLVELLRGQAASAEGAAGRLEIIFNGDFLEFAQTNPAAFSHTSDAFWCSELESLAKLETIIEGHPDIFEALRAFQENGNIVTIAAGNHDVDLYWPRVQARLRQVAGDAVRFELAKEWVERFDGRLQVGHGHLSDPANTFQHWDDPIRIGAWGAQHLEMCPGTLFMVKFVNKLEDRYPFADNLLPVTKLASVLRRDDKAGFVSIGWMFSWFALTTPASVLGAGASDDYGNFLLARIRTEPGYVSRLDAVLAQYGLEAERAKLRSGQVLKDDVAAWMFKLLGRIDEAAWQGLFGTPQGHTLGSDEVTLSALVQASFDDGKQQLRSVAQQRMDATGASVVVMGHTHQPDEKRLDGGMYYNPGSWTRYLELGPGQQVTLEDLKDESKYPYRLNYVRVQPGDEGKLQSSMICIDSG